MRKDFGKRTVVTPLPVLIIGTYDENDVPNAMNVAWGGQCSEHHVALNLGHKRKTLDNIRLNGAFTVSFATADTVVAADYYGDVQGYGINKIEVADHHAVPSVHVKAPIIEEFPLTLECRFVREEETAEGEVRVVGEVVNMSADESILDDKGKIDLGKARLLVFDSASLVYREVGAEAVADAFRVGRELLK